MTFITTVITAMASPTRIYPNGASFARCMSDRAKKPTPVRRPVENRVDRAILCAIPSLTSAHIFISSYLRRGQKLCCPWSHQWRNHIDPAWRIVMPINTPSVRLMKTMRHQKQVVAKAIPRRDRAFNLRRPKINYKSPRGAPEYAASEIGK